MTDTRRSFHHHLDEITADIVHLGALVTEALPRVTEALLDADLAAATAVIGGDDVLDRLSIDIEERCYQLLATQQPMAGDLRALVTALHLIAELERSGDLAVTIAKGVHRIRCIPADAKLRGLITDLKDEALALLRTAVDAYVDHDDAQAAALDQLDDRLDAVHRDYIARVLEVCRSGALDVQSAVQLALVGRYYERIGDHAVNIGERVRYLVSGWLPLVPE
ncbi:MAG: phosphate signaling complex protein PhoU [Acidimicrobiales bacterium]